VSYSTAKVVKVLDLSPERIRQLECQGVLKKVHDREGKALVGRLSRNNVGKIKLFLVGVDTAKDVVYGRLKIQDEGAGYCHFSAHYDDEFFRQLTAEQRIEKYHKGYLKREWRKVRARNEALDCRVYALAAYALLNVNII